MTNFSNTLADTHGRTATYLRLSITDRCNLSCSYCRGENPQYIPHDNILRYEELLRLAKISHNLGVKKIRITGGEPFMRKGCVEFLRALRKALPDLRLCITSNGILLDHWLDELAKLNLEAINISLDSLNEHDFAKITGKDQFNAVITNIEKLLAKGLHVKLNAVILRGITDMQIDNFLHLARNMPVDIRFIEFMPMGADTLWDRGSFFSAKELEELFRKKTKLAPARNHDEFAGPAAMHEIPNAPGRIGFISPLSRHFCGVCNRLRLTSNGNLRICLFDDREFHLRGLLRKGNISDEKIGQVIKLALERKPIGSELLVKRQTRAIATKKMVGIGG